ncbi:AglZ/HisF2 family acetamidino modification protein [Fluviicola taffensis]|uniref:imidazole glycerol-phosphate synthase n=1 Tax=Fluviicola taffensis (strain DSM 16823 / NCIMB 13979 / RW262) TaxID=755732 RepID=F2IA16_FLUTR|nr:AglZ/HisF2 family acetamidino modification protein [Fluviicola taffensis]AEA44174.1 imidazole glycerol phosphate synthase subunit hisF [Fluviicola taffensis DSM 16823]
MALPRCIPVLLLQNGGLVKTTQFQQPKYIGDPLNTIRIFNEKEVDELVFLDIDASVKGTPIPFKLLKEIAEECFMPLSYGGGIKTIESIRQIIQLGIEKVIIGTEAIQNPDFLKQAVTEFGSSSICVVLDIKKNTSGEYCLWTQSGTIPTDLKPVYFAQKLEELGVGELFVHSIDRDGTRMGYDLELIQLLRQAVTIPIIAYGGADTIADFQWVIQSGANAVAAGSLFVLHGKHQAVLISYPDSASLKRIYSSIQRK